MIPVCWSSCYLYDSCRWAICMFSRLHGRVSHSYIIIWHSEKDRPQLVPRCHPRSGD